MMNQQSAISNQQSAISNQQSAISNQQSANSRFLFIILFIIFQNSFSFAQDGSQLVRIHTVADITTMNNTILPARGNLIYVQSEEQIYYYDGSSWQPISSNISSGGNGWELSGNSINSNNFIGTTNNQDFRIRSNDTLRMIVKADGKVGINNDNPTGAFQVNTGSETNNSISTFFEAYDFPNNYNYDINDFEWGTVISDVSNLSNLTLTHLSFGSANLYNSPPTFDLSTANTTILGVVDSDPTIVIDNIKTSYWFFVLDADQFNNDNIKAIKIVFELNGNELRAREMQSRRKEISSLPFSDQNDSYIGTSNTNGWIFGMSYDIDLIRITADNNNAEESEFVINMNGNTGIGTDNPTEKLHVMGNILASGTIMPDYVFEHYFDGKSELNPNYKFLTLEKSIEYAKKNKHLPRVTSSKEIQDQGGILINKAVEQNLEKIEELYLYLYELQQEIKSLKERNNKSN